LPRKSRASEIKGEEFKPGALVKPEEKFKLSLLNIERRFVDIEFAISELVARVKDIDVDAIGDFKTRVEDLEDLILIEQAGIIELKRIMERVDQGLDTSADAADVEAIKDRVKKIENLARAAVQMAELPGEMSEEAKMRFKKLEEEIGELRARPIVESIEPLEVAQMKSNLRKLEEKMSVLKLAVEDAKRSVDRKVRDVVQETQISTADFEFVNSKIRSLKSAIDLLSDKRVEMDLKLTDLGQKVGSLEKEERASLPNKLLESLKASRKELEIVKLRTDSMERVIRELSKNLREVETAAKRFEGFEKLSALQNDVDKKLRQFRFMQDEIKRLSNRIEMMYDNLDKRLARIRTTEREVVAVTETLSDMKKDIDYMKFEMKNYANKGDVRKLLKGGAGERRVFEKTIDDVMILKEKMSVLDNAVRKLGALSIRGEVKEPLSPEIVSAIEGLTGRVSKIDRALYELQSLLGKAPVKGLLPDYENRMKDVVDKLVLLEARLTALESVFRTAAKHQAIFLE